MGGSALTLMSAPAGRHTIAAPIATALTSPEVSPVLARPATAAMALTAQVGIIVLIHSMVVFRNVTKADTVDSTVLKMKQR